MPDFSALGGLDLAGSVRGLWVCNFARLAVAPVFRIQAQFVRRQIRRNVHRAPAWRVSLYPVETAVDELEKL
jgi:hypothetical protein